MQYISGHISDLGTKQQKAVLSGVEHYSSAALSAKS
mgnify:CR=1 FL=1